MALTVITKFAGSWLALPQPSMLIASVVAHFSNIDGEAAGAAGAYNHWPRSGIELAVQFLHVLWYVLGAAGFGHVMVSPIVGRGR